MQPQLGACSSRCCSALAPVDLLAARRVRWPVERGAPTSPVIHATAVHAATPARRGKSATARVSALPLVLLVNCSATASALIRRRTKTTAADARRMAAVSLAGQVSGVTARALAPPHACRGRRCAGHAASTRRSIRATVAAARRMAARSVRAASLARRACAVAPLPSPTCVEQVRRRFARTSRPIHGTAATAELSVRRVWPATVKGPAPRVAFRALCCVAHSAQIQIPID